jgi:hypothetical protein
MPVGHVMMAGLDENHASDAILGINQTRFSQYMQRRETIQGPSTTDNHNGSQNHVLHPFCVPSQAFALNQSLLAPSTQSLALSVTDGQDLFYHNQPYQGTLAGAEMPMVLGASMPNTMQTCARFDNRHSHEFEGTNQNQYLMEPHWDDHFLYNVPIEDQNQLQASYNSTVLYPAHMTTPPRPQAVLPSQPIDFQNCDMMSTVTTACPGQVVHNKPSTVKLSSIQHVPDQMRTGKLCSNITFSCNVEHSNPQSEFIGTTNGDLCHDFTANDLPALTSKLFKEVIRVKKICIDFTFT